MAEGNTRKRVLHAAGRVVLQEGVRGLTLEAVAREAGVSKGGLLYHFASKDELLTGMVGEFVELIEGRMTEAMQADDAPGRWTRAYLDASTVDRAGDDPMDRLATAMLAAGASNTALLEPVYARQGDWQHAQHNDGIDPATAAIVRLAADGLWMNDLFGIRVVSDDEREAVIRRLRELTRAP
ncbi:transcriptional regulator, TetR family [Limimonas halophila]|uniref:Transcriptional regulator, TetR family n=1 Tax=Limimonas halophila TaxID=1082479 RepID=A0A1G7L6P9_9PROT|nr:TetR/AcrR family transcriptional regulator [Limimonas halophila]SDF45123.1 transcriptional regulator, TetR family [Limimonas halophila]